MGKGKALEAENADLKCSLAQLKKRFARLTEEHEACQEALQAAKESEQKLRAEAAPAATETNSLKEQLTVLQTKVQQQLPRLNELQRKVPQDQRVASLEEELRASRENEQNLRAEMEAAAIEARANDQRLRSELEAGAAENAELRQQLGRLQDEARELEDAFRALQQAQLSPASRTREASRQPSDKGRNLQTSKAGMQTQDEVDPARWKVVSERAKTARDEIDARVIEFVETTNCPLQFQRVNRGWYRFWSASEPTKPSDANHVEVVLKNGKLMMRMESSAYSSGWNNGKLGSIERFVTAFSA